MKSIKQYREDSKLTQDKLAKLVGRSTQTIRNYEVGAYKEMNDDLLVEFKKVFGNEFVYDRELNEGGK